MKTNQWESWYLSEEYKKSPEGKNDELNNAIFAFKMEIHKSITMPFIKFIQTKAFGYTLGLIMALLLASIFYGCSKPNQTPAPYVHRYATFTVWTNNLEAGEKMYIFYNCGKTSFEDSTTALTWKQTDSGTGVASIRALIRKPGTQLFIWPTNDTLHGSMVENGNTLSSGYVTQSTYLDLNFSNTY